MEPKFSILQSIDISLIPNTFKFFISSHPIHIATNIIQYLNNKIYSEAISSFFRSYKKHKAVIWTKKLIDNNNFIHINPLESILSLEQIAMEEKHNLYEWANSVKEFIVDTDFHTFYLNQEG